MSTPPPKCVTVSCLKEMIMSVVEKKELSMESSGKESATSESEKVGAENVGGGLGSRFPVFKLLFLCLLIF